MPHSAHGCRILVTGSGFIQTEIHFSNSIFSVLTTNVKACICHSFEVCLADSTLSVVLLDPVMSHPLTVRHALNDSLKACR